MKESISVVIPVFNREKLVVRCLESVFRQTYRPINLILVDNASTDKTFKVMEDWKRAYESIDFSVKIVSEERRGACSCRNRGLEEVKTDKMMFFDSDDTLRPECLERAVEAFEQNPRADVVVWHSMMHLLNGKNRKTKADSRDFFKSHLLHGLLRPQGFMARTRIFRDAGAWDETLPCWNDWELGVRIMLQSPEIVYLPQILSDIYSQEKSITGTTFLESKGNWELALNKIKRDLVDSENTEKDRMMLLLAYRTMILGAIYHREGDKVAGKLMLQRSLEFDNITPMLKILLRLSYHYTRLGGRGAYLLMPV